MSRIITWWTVALIFCVFGFVVRFWCQPVVVVVPHHNIVADVRKNLLQFVSERRVQTKKIILISPDHFSVNQHQLNTSTSSFEDLEGIALDVQKVRNDHGISNVYADITAIWPSVQIETLLVGQKVTMHQLELIVTRLKKVCGADCLLVVSVDFSHYLPANIAITHDETTMSALSRQDSKQILESEVDSPQSLWIASEFSKQLFAVRWRLYDHTISSGKETTSHVFGWYQRGISNYTRNETFVFITSDGDTSSLGERLDYGATLTSYAHTATLGSITLRRADKNSIQCDEKFTIISVQPDMILSGFDDGKIIKIGLTPIVQKNGQWIWGPDLADRLIVPPKCLSRIQLSLM